jgi:hypothetical protein
VIILADYLMGRDIKYPADYTRDVEAAAKDTVARVNLLLALFGEKRTLTSGWRPAALNATTRGASKTSLHIQGKAADIADGGGELDDWLMSPKGEEALIQCKLWHEHPSCTRGAAGGEGWCHVQTEPPRSGNRHFYR